MRSDPYSLRVFNSVLGLTWTRWAVKSLKIDFSFQNIRISFARKMCMCVQNLIKFGHSSCVRQKNTKSCMNSVIFKCFSRTQFFSHEHLKCSKFTNFYTGITHLCILCHKKMIFLFYSCVFFAISLFTPRLITLLSIILPLITFLWAITRQRCPLLLHQH